MSTIPASPMSPSPFRPRWPAAVLLAALLLGGCAKSIQRGPAPAGDAQSQDDRSESAGQDSAAAAQRFTVGFDDQAAGQPPAEFAPMVGRWVIQAAADGADGPVLAFDGAAGVPGEPATELDRYAQELFADQGGLLSAGVRAAPLYAFSAFRPLPQMVDGKVSVRFFPDGSDDQAAGIVFALRPNGDYLVVRANGPEKNLVMLRLAGGRRDLVAKQVDLEIAPRAWHSLSLEIKGRELRAVVDDQPPLELTMDRPPAGRIGLWAVSDSAVLFDDVEVDARP